MIYAIIGIVLACVAFVLAAVVDVRVFGEIDQLERQYNGVAREMEVLLDSISNLTMQAARISERADMFEDKNKELEKQLKEFGTKLDEIDKRNLDAEKVAQEIIQRAEESAKEVEKQWSDGLQNMLGWNPFSRDNAGGGT